MRKVCILMSTYNGEKYLEKQIKSITLQSEKDFQLLIRDDGSTDKTLQILEHYSNKFENIFYIQGENLGPAQSFLELLKKAPKADYYFFADQDDVWEVEKVSRAIALIGNDIKPALYYSNVTLVNNNLETLQNNSMFLNRPTDIYRLLLRNEIIGCTMCINQSLKYIVSEIETPQQMIMHDHWIALVNALFDGKFIFDDQSFILYRQHDANVVGENKDYLNLIKKHFKTQTRGLRSNLVKIIVDSKVDIDRPNFKFINHIYTYEKKFSSKLRLLGNKNFYKSSVFKNVLWIIDLMLNNY